MPQIDVKLTTTADLSGLNQTREGVKQLEQDTNRAGSEWDKFAKGLGKKFSSADIGKGILQGIGLGSGAAVIQKAVEFIVEPFKQAAEQAQRIAEYSDRTTKAIEDRLRLRRTDQQQLDLLARKEKELGDQIRKANTEDSAKLSAERAEMQLEISKLQKAIDEKKSDEAKKLADEAKRKAEEARRDAEQEAEKIARLREQISSEEQKQFQTGESVAMKIARLRREAAQFESDSEAAGTELQRQTLKLEASKRLADLAGAELQLKQRAEKLDADKKAADFAKLNAQEQLNKLTAEDLALANEYAGLDQTNVVQRQRALEIDERRLAIVREMSAAASSAVRADQARLAAQLRELRQQEADLNGDFGRTEASKWPERKKIIEDQIAAQTAYIETQNKLADATQDPAAKAVYTSAAKQGEGELGQYQQSLAALGPDPSSYSQQMVAAVTTAQDSIGTLAQQTARTFMEVGESVRTSMGSAFADMVLKGGSASDKIRRFGQQVGISFIQSSAQMLADWIYKHTVMAAVRKIFHVTDVAETAGAETAKTTITTSGVGARILLTMKETGVALAQAGIKAMSAVASIPYVGPVLAVAALGAVIAAGAKAMNGGFAFGGYTGGDDRKQVAGVVHEDEWVSPSWMINHPVYGPLIAWLEGARRGERGYALGGFVGDWFKTFFPSPLHPERGLKQLIATTLHPPGHGTLMNAWYRNVYGSTPGIVGPQYSSPGDYSPSITAPAYEPVSASSASGAGSYSGTNGQALTIPQPIMVGSMAEAESIKRGSVAEVQILQIVQANRYKIFGRKLS